MRSKIIKLLVLVGFVSLLISAAIWMFNKYTLQSPYYEESPQYERTDP